MSQHEESEAPKSALFIVARLPIAGQTKTRLGRAIGHVQAADLYRAFLHDIGTRFIAAGKHDGYDLWWYFTAPEEIAADDFAAQVPAGGQYLRQRPGEFGERLWQGFRDLRSQGYERIVVLGSDSPQIPAAWIAQAFAALDTHDVVLGPADDGGYYLLGQRGEPSDLFTYIPMSTPLVHAHTVAAAQALDLTIAALPTTFDIDEAADLASLRTVLQADPMLAPATLTAINTLQITVPLEAAYGAE